MRTMSYYPITMSQYPRIKSQYPRTLSQYPITYSQYRFVLRKYFVWSRIRHTHGKNLQQNYMCILKSVTGFV